MRPEAAMLRGMAAFLEGMATFLVASVQHDTTPQVQQMYSASSECYQMAHEVDEYEGDA